VSCAISQGTPDSGGGRSGGGGGDPAFADSTAACQRRARSYSGCRPCHARSASRCRARWHAGALQARCRSPTRASGRNHRRQTEHGRFLRTCAAFGTGAHHATTAAPSPGDSSRRLPAGPLQLQRDRRPCSAERSEGSFDAQFERKLSAAGAGLYFTGSFLTSTPGSFFTSVKAHCATTRLRDLVRRSVVRTEHATRGCASGAGLRSEIDCTAGRSSADESWRWH
jgi:hypothetical protein